jgi:pectin methylesterase-like acyl-CoA thioesterase
MNMRKLILVIAPAILLAGCGAFGPKQKSLDEFAVARNAPLVIPPDYSLTPPVAGTVSMSAQDAQTQAIEALFGGPAPRSSTETSVLERAGRDRAAMGIRSTAGDPETKVLDKGQSTQAIIAAQPADSETASAQTPQ